MAWSISCSCLNSTLRHSIVFRCSVLNVADNGSQIKRPKQVFFCYNNYMEKIDLFEKVVRLLAIKPLRFDEFNLEQAKSIIKSEKADSITFIDDHHAFEDVIEQTANRVGELGIKTGTAYIFVRGGGCTERMKRNLLEIIMSVHKIIVFGDQKSWPFFDAKMEFVNLEDYLEDNHQRFFIYQSPSYNVALVARHVVRESNEVIEAAMTTDPEAVALVSQVLGSQVYKQQNQI